jgi:ribonuclease HII
MQAGRNHETDCIHQRDDFSVIGIGIGAMFVRDFASIVDIRIDHGNQLAVRRGGIFVGVPFTEMTDTNNSKLEYLRHSDRGKFKRRIIYGKKLSAARRATLEAQIKQKASAWAIAESSQQEVDELNILQASLLAMKRALLALPVKPEQVLVDGNRLPPLDGYRMLAIVGGDLSEPCISAASILAKEYRDRQMLELDRLYPEYRFAQHKGYPTALHRELLQKHGVSPVHRRSFRPVRELLP